MSEMSRRLTEGVKSAPGILNSQLTRFMGRLGPSRQRRSGSREYN